MTIIEFIDVLQGIKDERPFKLSYRLLKDGRLNQFIKNCGSTDELIEFMVDVANAEAGDFG